MKKYYINQLYYNNWELKAADKFILPFLKAFTHIVVSRRWAEGALKWAETKLDEYYERNPRAGKIQTSLNWPENAGDTHAAFPKLNIGRISITLIPVEAEFDFFEVPMFPPEP